jgi:hypothetical protein
MVFTLCSISWRFSAFQFINFIPIKSFRIGFLVCLAFYSVARQFANLSFEVDFQIFQSFLHRAVSKLKDKPPFEACAIAFSM